MEEKQNEIKNIRIKEVLISNEKKSYNNTKIKNNFILFIFCLIIIEIIILFYFIQINKGNQKKIRNKILKEVDNSENKICNDKNCLECDLIKSQCSKCHIGYKLSNGLCLENYSFKATYMTKYDHLYVSLINYKYEKDIIEILSLDNETMPISSAHTFDKSGNHSLYFIMNTSSMNSLRYMFKSAENLISISFSSSFNTENITDMKGMFYKCTSLYSVENLSNLNSKNVIDMGELFFNCSNLPSIDLTGLNTENVKNMSYMFSGCLNLNSLNINNINTKMLFI
jgi:surface protein